MASRNFSMPSQIGLLSLVTDNFRMNDNLMTGCIPDSVRALSSSIIDTSGIDANYDIYSDNHLYPTPCPAFFALSRLYADTMEATTAPAMAPAVTTAPVMALQATHGAAHPHQP